MKVLSYIFILLVILISSNALSCPLCWLTGKSHGDHKETSVNAECTLKVDGMTCDACVKAVEKALKSVAGVHDAQVFLNEGKAVVKYEDKKTKIDDLIKAIEQAGFKAHKHE
jgi:copper chaperone CopZ